MVSDEHISALLVEAVEALSIQPDGFYVDATFGRGGHSQEILRRLSPAGRLIALDRDVSAVNVGRQWKDERFLMVHSAFSRIGEVLSELGIAQVNGILLDLGVSSPQLDTPERGMSFRFDAPLDMRMDTTQGETVADFLARADQHEIGKVLRDYGEERSAHAIAKAIIAARCECSVSTTGRLADVVAKVTRSRDQSLHPATRSFQALRIFINRELEELEQVLPQCVDILAPGGRLAVISFHSLEDRLVKRFMRSTSQPPAMPLRLPVKAADLPSPRLRLIGKSVRPKEAEIAVNPRIRSAVMRVAEKR
ncbi:MAG: 16S rRNA (cytosine(1402)-N(4))-methyltransferase RsmH [Rhodocyclaceae bacterium]|nr:16S rRNA (cytosine(1402)-N(4))-methyltransferase RsmH [Rhodocyclaceae bacterium]